MSSIFSARWIPQEHAGKMPCLSIQQPFATAIMLQRKMIELREWMIQTPQLPLWIAIHTGKMWYGGVDFTKKTNYKHKVDIIAHAVREMELPPRPRDYPTCAVIGLAHLIRCGRMNEQQYHDLAHLHRSDAPWDRTTFGWQFDQVILLPEPLPMRGYPGIFAIDALPFLNQKG